MSRARLALLVGAVAAIAIGSGLVSATAVRDDGACDERFDPLDPGSLQHVLPNSPPPSYVTDPPTSGPHQAGRLPGGVLDTPVPAPVQVGALEDGQVIIQHRPGVAIDKLRPLASDDVVIAPNPSRPTPNVATAWRRTLRCSSADVRRIRSFAADHVRREGAHP